MKPTELSPILAGLVLLITAAGASAQPNSCKNITTTTPDYTWWNGTNWLDYLEPAPTGIDARYAWRFAGGRGAGIKVFDVTGGYRFSHEDLPDPFYPLNPTLPPADYDHETGTVGIIAACDNGYGVIGIANQAQIGFERPTKPRAPGDDRFLFARAISNAVSLLSPGDVIWISGDMSGAPVGGTAVCPHINFGHVPIEWEQWEFNAISDATARGIIFVEGAGNGEMNLDSSLLPTGWTANLNQRYTAGFGGTSGATPMVAGAVACIQGFLKARDWPPLTAIEMRDLLVATGLPQQQTDLTGDGMTDNRHIGPTAQSACCHQESESLSATQAVRNRLRHSGAEVFGTVLFAQRGHPSPHHGQPA